MSWESIELVPETPVRSRGHGISRTRPALMSSSTSCRTVSSLPLATSRFICSSHSSSFQPCNQAASSARSSNESRSIALWISAKLIDQLYRVAIVSAIVESSKESLATTLFVRMSNAFGSSKDDFAHLQSHVKLDQQWRRRLRNSVASRKQRADRDFYKRLTPQERLAILFELLNHAPEQRLERVYRVTKLPRR